MWACTRGELFGRLRDVGCVSVYEGLVVWACMRDDLCERVRGVSCVGMYEG